ncbi:tail fiber domain-containing protein [Erysipelothrix sp. HDW6C]|uniref:tail fiber domain-containing protein n=1 Tax=Erysipelothrix sp. HDW6C TaxID=2714930 RepID=UPI001407B733|nr:tail fiber domain-containing protein [Erysipelothrix sp. HDW6C]QIK70834.1 tail fiber domain-containing protein [Erysipelothrix sp. HDW6C]
MKELLQTLGSGMRKRITLLSTNEVIEDIKDFKVSFDSNLWKPSVQSLTATIPGRLDLDNTDIKVELGVWDMNLTQDPTDEEITWYNFGTFIVARGGYEYSDDQNETTITNAYDLLARAYATWNLNDLGITYPNTIKNTVEAICALLGIPLAVDTWTRSNHVIEEDKWSNNDHTYMDALEQIAQFCNSTISIENDSLVVKEINHVIIDEISSGEKTMKREKSWGPANVLNVSREPQHDNYAYPENWEDIPLDERVELVFANNQIIDKRREELTPGIFDSISAVRYVPFEYSGFGYLTMKFGDYVSFVDKDGETYRSYITKGTWTATTGFQEMLGSDLTANVQSEFVVYTDRRRQGLNVYLMVDQQNGKIQTLVEEIGDRSDRTTSITQDLDSIELLVRSTAVGFNLIPNLNALLEIENNTYPLWTFEQGGLRTIFRAPERTRTMQSPTFDVVDDGLSLSGKSKQFYTVGTAKSEKAFIVPDSIYSYRCKRTIGNTPFDLYINEYNEKEELINRTKHTLDGQKMIEAISFTPAQLTMWASLEFVTRDDSLFNIAEEMFVRGNPVGWSEDANDVKIYARNLVTLLDNRLTVKITEVSDDIHNAGVEITAREGIRVYGKNFLVQNEDRTKDIFKVVTIDGEEQVYMYGSIQSEGGKIAFDSENKEIRIGEVKLKNWNANDTLGMYGSQFTLILGKNGGLSINKNIGGTASDWVIYKNFDNNTTTGYFDDLQTTSLRSDTIRANNAIDFVTMSRLTVTSNLNSNTLTATGVYPSSFAGSKWIGNGSARWEYIYLQNQPNVASDKRYKRNIAPIDPLLLDCFEDVQEMSFETIHDDKFSVGYIGQDVERALFKYCSIVWGYHDANEWMKKFKMLQKDESYLSLLYAEIKVIRIAVVDRRSKRLEEENRHMREQLENHEARMTRLEKLLLDKEEI